MDNTEKNFEDVVREVPENTKKTGERKRSAMIIAGSAAIGAFLGDIFYGRSEIIQSDLYIGDGQTIKNYAIGRDHGGLLEDFAGKDQFQDHYSLTTGVENANGLHPENYTITEDTFQSIKNGYFSGEGFDNIYYDGAGIGAGAGGATGFAADWLSKRKAKKAEMEEY